MSKVRIYGELDLLDPTLQNEAKRICDERNALDLARCDELEMDPHHLFVVDIDEHDSSLLEFASQNKMIDIFKNDYMMPCEFVFSESFLSSIRGKTTSLVFTDFDALKIDEKKLPAGVHIVQGIDLKDKKMKSKKSAIAREYISKKGREAAWDTGLDDFSIRAFADSYFCMIADELLYTYRDKIFVGAFNEHSFAFLMKALNKGMISIVCDIKQIDDPFYDDYAFEVTPSFIEKYESKREKRMTMKPLDSHDKPI